MNTDLLKTFLAICESMNFTAAAEKVGRTQSAVSLQVQRLEGILGRPLFVREASGLKLTEHGVLLKSHAENILKSVDLAKAAFQLNPMDGVVVVGIPDDYAPRLLSTVLRSFSQLYPNISINLVIEESRNLVSHLADRSVDMALITEGEGPVKGGHVAFRDSIVWVAPLDNDLHLRDPLPIAIWEENDGYARRMFETLSSQGRQHRLALTCRSMTGLRGAVEAGIAVTAMMRSSVTERMRELTDLDGFPVLGDLNVYLERAHQKKSPLIDHLETHLLLELRESTRKSALSCVDLG